MQRNSVFASSDCYAGTWTLHLGLLLNGHLGHVLVARDLGASPNDCTFSRGSVMMPRRGCRGRSCRPSCRISCCTTYRGSRRCAPRLTLQLVLSSCHRSHNSCCTTTGSSYCSSSHVPRNILRLRRVTGRSSWLDTGCHAKRQPSVLSPDRGHGARASACTVIPRSSSARAAAEATAHSVAHHQPRLLYIEGMIPLPAQP